MTGLIPWALRWRSVPLAPLVVEERLPEGLEGTLASEGYNKGFYCRDILILLVE